MSSRVIKRPGIEQVSFQVHTFPNIHQFADYSLSGTSSYEMESESGIEEARASATAPPSMVIMGVPEEEVSARESTAFQRGFQDAEMRAQQLLAGQEERAARALERSILELAQYQKRLAGECERQVARLSMEIARKIVHHEVRIDSKIIMAMIKVALEYVADAHKIRVRVHPSDLTIIQKSQQHGASIDLTGIPMEWVSDPGMERGGFVIESDMGQIDGRLSQQFQEIEKSFFGDQR